MRQRTAVPAAPILQRASSENPPALARSGSDTLSQRASARKVRSSNLFRIRTPEETPRQVSTGLVLISGLVAFAYLPDITFDARPGSSFRRCMWALLFFSMAYCTLNTRDGVMDRPHPAVWRWLHGWNLWYCMIGTILLVLPVADGVQVMQWIFPGVERPIAVHNSETLGFDHLTCAINAANVKRQLFSIWFLAHSVGWWAKMLMLRSLTTCIVYSSVFELTELTLQFMVPEFQECWWDSVIMDWLIANTLIGMMAGKLTLKILNVTDFNWSPHEVSATQKVLQLFTPATWSEYAWNPANDPVTLVLNAGVWIVMAVGEVNSFFLINILHLPRNHPFNAARQMLMCLCAVPAVEEWYEYTRHVRAHYLGKEWFEYTTQYKGRKPRIGHFTWLLAITVALETLTVAKYSMSLGQVRKAKPGPEIWLPWFASLSIFGIYFITHCWFWFRKERAYPVWLRVLKWSSCAPLLFLLRLYAF